MRATDQTPERIPLSARTTLRRPSGDSSGPVQSTDLLKGQKSVVIEHNGSIYRLQATKLGKLILTK
ncbi:MAG: hemin uptake protein HemP [Gallionella sp.]|nr:hemin uptake protein HemP [Gallionella sp.]